MLGTFISSSVVYALVLCILPSGYTKETVQFAATDETPLDGYALFKPTLLYTVGTDAIFYVCLATGMYIVWEAGWEPYPLFVGTSYKSLVISMLGSFSLQKILDVCTKLLKRSEHDKPASLKAVTYGLIGFWTILGPYWLLHK
eukprot:TRINITY_DN915_c0_g1_i2.p1 TRINITY_DN915_c0_g1~~TRINITY_DN915_c0_g1_i2.p1  ORF type:complete len:143 (+),score=36.01 TRINITY_DN915_c0_g1_i2:322-750(+)